MTMRCGDDIGLTKIRDVYFSPVVVSEVVVMKTSNEFTMAYYDDNSSYHNTRIASEILSSFSIEAICSTNIYLNHCFLTRGTKT